MSFALLHSRDDILAAKENHAVAVVKGKEDYSVLKNCFKDVFSGINEMVREKTLDVGGKVVIIIIIIQSLYTLKTGVFNTKPWCVLVHPNVCTIAHKGV